MAQRERMEERTEEPMEAQEQMVVLKEMDNKQVVKVMAKATVRQMVKEIQAIQSYLV